VIKARAVIAAFNAITAIAIAHAGVTWLALIFAFFAGVMACTVVEELYEQSEFKNGPAR
jgi:zinc transporter ZupT